MREGKIVMIGRVKEIYRNHVRTEDGLSKSFRRVRRVHEVALVVWGILLLDWITEGFLNKLFDHFGIKSYFIDFPVLFLFSNIGFVCGLILVYCYRNREIFLPARSMMTYLTTAFFWSIGIYRFVTYDLNIHMFEGSYYYFGTIAWFVFLLCIIVPHILWRRKKPTPPILDAVLISMLLVLVYKMDLYLGKGRLHTFFPWSMENMPDPIFLSLLVMNWGILRILGKKSGVWKYAAVSVLNIGVYMLILLPSEG